jgi:DNA-3-methyladenine glycosylase I
MNEKRCPWARNELSIRYHDEEWGVPVHDDLRWFEFLILEGAQAGLSWDTILRKRENYRNAFASFDPAQVAKFGERKIAGLLTDEGIVRNRLKINSAIGNAKAFLEVQKEFGSFDEYIWGLVGGRPRINAWRALKQVPARTKDSDSISKVLIGRGFRFVGSTICYAMMQATGMVNDHLIDCARYKAVMRDSRKKSGVPRLRSG